MNPVICDTFLDIANYRLGYWALMTYSELVGFTVSRDDNEKEEVNGY